MKKVIIFLMPLLFITSACSNTDEPGVVNPPERDVGPDTEPEPIMGACCVDEGVGGGSCLETSWKKCQEGSFVDFDTDKACTEDFISKCKQLTSSDEDPEKDTRVSCCVNDYCVSAANKERCNSKGGVAFPSLSDCEAKCGNETVGCCTTEKSCKRQSVHTCLEGNGTPYSDLGSCRSNCQKDEPPEKGACCTDLDDGVCKMRTKAGCDTGFFHADKTCNATDICNPKKKLSACCMRRRDRHVNNLACHTFDYKKCLEKNGTPYQNMTMCVYRGCNDAKNDAICHLAGECRTVTSTKRCKQLGGTPYLSRRDCRRASIPHACCLNRACNGNLLPDECRRAGGFVHSGGEGKDGVGCTSSVERQCKMFMTDGACCSREDGERKCEKTSEWACVGGGNTFSNEFHADEECQDVSCF